MYQADEVYRKILEDMMKDVDTGKKASEVEDHVMDEYVGQLDQFSKDVYAVLIDKPVGEACDKVGPMVEWDGSECLHCHVQVVHGGVRSGPYNPGRAFNDAGCTKTWGGHQ